MIYEQAMATLRASYSGHDQKNHRIEARGSMVDDEILYDAALRNLQTLFEATQQLPEDKKSQCTDILWRENSGFRNILVHNYLGGYRSADYH